VSLKEIFGQTKIYELYGLSEDEIRIVEEGTQ
jgi:hypothetical protein